MGTVIGWSLASSLVTVGHIFAVSFCMSCSRFVVADGTGLGYPLVQLKSAAGAYGASFVRGHLDRGARVAWLGCNQ